MVFAAALSFLCALVGSAMLTAAIRRVAPRIGLTDAPDGRRKLHAEATPLGGGLAVFLSSSAVFAILLGTSTTWAERFEGQWGEIVSLLVSAAVIVVVGLFDDRFGLRGRQKLLGQFVAACVLLAGGLPIHKLEVFGLELQLGLLSIPFTLFWLLGAINAVNLLDGIDGLATTVGLILTCTIALMAAMVGRAEVAIMAAIFAGGLLGFLPYNFPPARVFLGDAGSMLIGLMVGAMAIQGSLKGPGTVLLAAPLAVWTIPIFDSAAAVLRRKLTGRSIYATDRGHLHHRLLGLLGSNRKVLGLVAVCCLFTSSGALVSVSLNNDLIAVLSCSGVVIIFVATGLFGRAEFVLLASRLRNVGLSLATPRNLRNSAGQECLVRIQGSRQWELLWQTLVESVDKTSLSEIRLDVNLPAVHEAYNALWRRSISDDHDRRWRFEMPLTVAERTVGRLTVIGQGNGGSVCGDMARLFDLIEPFEARLSEVAEEKSADATLDEAAPVVDTHDGAAIVNTVAGPVRVGSSDPTPPRQPR